MILRDTHPHQEGPPLSMSRATFVISNMWCGDTVVRFCDSRIPLP